MFVGRPNITRGVCYETIRICNLEKVDRFQSKLVSSIVIHKHTSLLVHYEATIVKALERSSLRNPTLWVSQILDQLEKTWTNSLAYF